MKKKFSVPIVGIVIIGVVFGLTGTALVSQAAPANKDQSLNGQVLKPVSATNIQVVKKVILSPNDIGDAKGKPASPPGLDKDKSEGTATGILGDSATGDKYAVVIGICDYPGTDYDLCASDGDSYNMYRTLIELYGYDPANVYWYRDMGGDPNVDGVPNRQNIINAINFIEAVATADDEVVFFFSGHGASGIADDGDVETTDESIVVHDDDGLMDVDGSAELDLIWDGELKGLFNGFPTSRIIFVFDSCLAGGMNDVVDVGRVVVMATAETKSAYVYSTGELGEGVFSHYFVNEGMFQKLADGTNALKISDGNVAIEEAFDYAKAHIPPYLRNKQKPVISDSFDNDLLL